MEGTLTEKKYTFPCQYFHCKMGKEFDILVKIILRLPKLLYSMYEVKEIFMNRLTLNEGIQWKVIKNKHNKQQTKHFQDTLPLKLHN